jgi:hypothetical protein
MWKKKPGKRGKPKGRVNSASKKKKHNKAGGCAPPEKVQKNG